MREWDWTGAEMALREVVELEPMVPMWHLHLAELLVCLGRQDEGREVFAHALRVADRPYSHCVLEYAGALHYMLGDLEDALNCLGEVTAARPRSRFGHWWMAVCLCALNRFDDALEALKRSEQTIDGFYNANRTYMTLWNELVRGWVYASMGRRREAGKVLDDLYTFPDGLSDRSLTIAALHFLMGSVDDGFRWLQKSVDAHDQSLRRIVCFRLPAEVVEDARYARILGMAGLPTPARS
jgi:tetratricopeptide (TPR) repeat protein